MLLLPIGLVGRIPNRASIFKFCTCSVLQGSNMGTMKLNKIMNKFLGASKSRKKKFHALPIGGTPEFLDYVANYKSAGKTDRRMTVLNKLFMQNITDILSTGELCPEICGKGIQISKVKVTSGYNQVNVYWLANGTEEDLVTENLLSNLAPELRHSLSQLRIMGSVPKIEFIKDSSYFKYMQVENILKTADMGEDFEPTSLASDWKSVKSGLPHSATPPPPSDVPSKEGSESEAESKEVHDEELPCMRMDTFGLNHDIIMKRVTQAMDKAKAAHRRDPSRKISNNITDSFEATDVIDAKERQKLFQEYLLKKKLELKKQFKKERRYSPEIAINEQDAAINEFKDYYDENYSEDFERSDDHIEYDDRPNKNI